MDMYNINKEKFKSKEEYNKKDNMQYILFKDSLNNKGKYLESINYLESKKNILYGLFSKFFIFYNKNNKDTYLNIIKNKKFILSELNRLRIFK